MEERAKQGLLEAYHESGRVALGKYMRIYFLLMLSVILPAVSLGAFNVVQLYSGESAGCWMNGSANVTCQDGLPIVVSFMVGAQPYPYYYYGNFTAYATKSDGMPNPTNIYGYPCTVSSSSTMQCFTVLQAMPITSLNGIARRNITVNLVSDVFPQINLTKTMVINITHYANATEYRTVMLYDSVSSQSELMSSTYYYFCSIYQLCNQTIADLAGQVAGDVSNATSAMNSDAIGQAYAYLVYANLSISEANRSYASFRSRSNEIVNNLLSARAIIGNASSTYAEDANALIRCNSSFAAGINSTITELNYTPQSDTVNASYGYLSEAKGLQSNLTGEIGRCSGHAASSAQSSQSSGQQPNVQKRSLLPALPVSYVVIVPALLVIVVSLLKFRGIREAKRLREEANRHDSMKQAGSIVPQQAPQPNAGLADHGQEGW